MIIIRITPGFANSIMKYCAAYALSRELKDEEIVIDIGTCQNSAWGYLVDYLNIPNHKKISYYTIDSRNLSSIPMDVLKDADIVKKENYPKIENAFKLHTSGHTLYLDDWFMDQLDYYDKYMDELRPMLTIRGKSDNIDAFQKMILGRTSIGVHFRRTDMLYADFARPTEDNYYKAAIEYCREKIDKNALFCVFSDDIHYAENLLGFDDNIKYIHFVGYDDADVEEFLCLSLCDHRIRPNSSSYSDLADRINGKKERKCILQGDIEDSSLRDKAAQWKYWAKRRILTVFFKNGFNTYREELKRYDFCRDNYHVLNKKKIEKYSARFIRKQGSREEDLQNILKSNIKKDNADVVLEKMRHYELDYMTPPLKEEMLYRYKKFCCLYNIGDYDRALGLGDYIWGNMSQDISFRKRYADILRKMGFEQESRMISNRIWEIEFIVFSTIPSLYSTNLYGLGELAVGLAKMGGIVTIIETPANKTEEIYVRNHETLTNRHEVSLGCKQYMNDENLKKYGYERFIRDRKHITERLGKTLVVITKDLKILHTRVEGVSYVLMDDMDKYDPERNMRDNDTADMDSAAEMADYILTCCPEQYNDIRNKLIVYNNSSYQTPYWETTKRWRASDCHRLSERTISMCMALKGWSEDQTCELSR